MTRSPDAELSGQDLAFLAWESGSRPMHIAATADFEAPGTASATLARLRTELTPAIAREPMLSRRLARRLFRAPQWVTADAFEPADHVRSLAEVAAPGEPVATTRARVLATPLDPKRPLWEIWLEPLDLPGRVRLHFKVHHVVADGIGALALLERLLGGRRLRSVPGRRAAERQHELPPPREVRGSSAPESPESAERRRPARGGGLLRFVREHLARGIRTPLTGSVDGARTYHALPIDAAAFRSLRARLEVSANDLLLALVAGGLERWLSSDGEGPLPDRVRAFCPVSLREPGERSGGNRIAPWFVPLAIADTDLAERARGIHAETRRLRRQRAERGGDRMARLVRRFGSWLAGLGMAVAAWRNAFDLVVTNVPAPRSELALSGGRLESLAAYPPLFPGQRVCIAVVQTGERWTLALHTGFRDPASADRLAEALREELSEAFGNAEATAATSMRRVASS